MYGPQGGQAREFMDPLFSKNHRCWRGKKLLASTFFFSLIFSQLNRRRIIRSLRSLRSEKQKLPSLLRQPYSNGRLDRPDRKYVQSRRQVGSCAHPDHVPNSNREEQDWTGGRYDQSRFRSMTVNRATSQEISTPTTFVIDLFNTGKLRRLFPKKRFTVRKTRSFH